MNWFLAICFVVFLAFAAKADQPCWGICPKTGTPFSVMISPFGPPEVVVPPKVMPGPGPTVKVTPAPKAKAERQHKVLKFLRHPLHRRSCR